MATLDSLANSNLLEKLEVELEPKEMPWRCLYGTPEFVEWLKETLPYIKIASIYGETTPLEQVDDLFHEYIVGAKFNNDRRFKKLSSKPEYFVWELKSPDIRVFGWVPKKNSFICAFGDKTDQIKLWDSYNTYVARTKYVRNYLDLDEPKCVESKEYIDVISDQA